MLPYAGDSKLVVCFMVKKKRNPSDTGENPMGPSNGDILRYSLSNSLSLLEVQLECSTPYPIPLNGIPILEEINPSPENFLSFFNRL